MAGNYNAVYGNSQQNLQQPTPYGSGDPYYNESTGFITPMQSTKKRLSPWIKFGVPVGILVAIGVIVGAVVATRHSSSGSSSASSSGSSPGSASSAISAKSEIGLFATATNSFYEMPLYPQTVSNVGSMRRGDI